MAFVAGDFVALINTHWSRRIVGKRQVHKVYKNGNFTLLNHEGKPDPQQWSPNFDGTSGHRTGKDHFSREHVVLWTDRIDQEIAEGKARIVRDKRKAAILEVMQQRYVDLPEATLHQIETALKFAGYLVKEDTNGTV